MRRNQNKGNKNSVGQFINNVGSAGVELQHIAEDPGLDNETRNRPDMGYSTLREPAHGSPHSPIYMELVYSRDYLDGIPESPPSYQESGSFFTPINTSFIRFKTNFRSIKAHCEHSAVET